MGGSTTERVGCRVLLCHPDDAERIARTHVRKEGLYESALFDSVLSTTDNDKWSQQRHMLVEAFLPLSSLAKILPVSLARAQLCTKRLREAAVANGGIVDMSDFLLHEAQAQLQLALLGAPEELMEQTNSDIRATFLGDLDKGRPGALGDAMRMLMEALKKDPALALPSDAAGRAVRGPLSQALLTSGLPASALYGNLLLILFAGHDTTGHTMTWLLFELARNRVLQSALRAECEHFLASFPPGEAITYASLSRLPLMDKCITEALRLWPAVANGTFRQLQYEDTVLGPSGTRVALPAGTMVNIANWSRHRNKELWGADADEFNPYREFAPAELSRVGCPMAGISPQSQRFSPFAHSPRNCLGRNFAMMEARLIMVHLLHEFEFTLAPPYDTLHSETVGPSSNRSVGFRGVNRITMGPLDMEHTDVTAWGERQLYAMKMFVKPRA